jgi:hypothetical protein
MFVFWYLELQMADKVQRPGNSECWVLYTIARTAKILMEYGCAKFKVMYIDSHYFNFIFFNTEGSQCFCFL